MLVIVLAIAIGVPIVVGLVMVARPALRPRRLRQAPVEQLPTDGPPRSPAEVEGRRPDGSPVPGSEEYRHRQGKP